MDPIVCCLLGICCPPEAQRAALAAYFQKFAGLDAAQAQAASAALFDVADLMPNAKAKAQIAAKMKG